MFNAGKGSVFTSTGTHEMDAAIMNGQDLNAGAIALVTNIKNPVSLARIVMEKSDHVFLAGKGADKFAKSNQCKLEPLSYFFNEKRFNFILFE